MSLCEPMMMPIIGLHLTSQTRWRYSLYSTLGAAGRGLQNFERQARSRVSQSTDGMTCAKRGQEEAHNADISVDLGAEPATVSVSGAVSGCNARSWATVRLGAVLRWRSASLAKAFIPIRSALCLSAAQACTICGWCIRASAGCGALWTPN